MTSIFYHIQAAQHLLSLPRDKDDQVMQFLEKVRSPRPNYERKKQGLTHHLQVFHLYDVSIALSQGSEPLAEPPRWKDIKSDSTPTTPQSQSQSQSQSPASPSSHPLLNIDSVFGLALKLWPILHRLAGLRSMTEELHVAIASQQTLKIAVLKAEHQSATIAIGTALEKWHPLRTTTAAGAATAASSSSSSSDPLEPESWSSLLGAGRAPTPQVAVCYHHALAYREGALVYLHRAVRRIPASHALVRDASLATMRHCTSAVHQGSSKIPLWPLFIAACNVEGHDRMVAAQTFQIMGKTQQAAAVKQLWSVVASVWKKLDSSASDEPEVPDPFTLWRDVGQSMGQLVFLG